MIIIVTENNENDYSVGSNSFLIIYNEPYKQKLFDFVNIKFANLI